MSEKQEQEQEQGQEQSEKKRGSWGGKILSIFLIILAIAASVALVCGYGTSELPFYVPALLVGLLWVCAILTAIWFFSNNFWLSHWHGIVQLFTIIGAATASIALACSGLAGYDLLLFLGMIWAFAIAVICSHAYNDYPKSLRGQALKKQATWLHANFSWRALSIWIIVTSLYCNCATIYISGQSFDPENQRHILIYSILSLVLSLGTYVLRPANRAEGFREAYVRITEALFNHSESDSEALAKAIIEAEQIISKQDTMSPS